MRKAKNLGNRLMAMLLSAAMIFAPIFESVPVYAAEAGAEMEGIGTLPEETPGETVGQTGTEDANDIQMFSAMNAALFAASASDFSSVGGWNESIYAEITGVKAANVTDVSWTGTMTGKLGTEDLKYLVRDKGSNVRIDIPGLKAGTYTLNVTVGGQTLTKSGIEVYAYDRSGFAHFGYNGKGVGAYNDDGTLKKDAIVLYVTDSNKNAVTLTAGGVTVTGIGNILNSVGKDTGGGKTSNGGKPNTNQGVIQKLATEGKPLVVRFVGTVSESGLKKKGTYTASEAGQIDGLTDYDSTDNGGSVGDNGHMARIQSGKDITLEGIGYDATIDGWGFHFISEGANPNLGESFEVRNLIFINTPEDAVGMEGQQDSKNASSKLSSKVERCWIHNNEFYSPDISGPAESDKSEGDGSVDFKRGQYFTCSYNYFEGCHKTNLVGSADYSLQFNLSYHHNYWYLCKARGPLTRRANVHMYNNIFEMQTDYAQNTRADAYIFSEYNLFYACKSPQAVEGGAIKSYHDSISSVIQNKGTLGTVVTDKATIVPNNCQFAAEKINYSKFDTDSTQSYIPAGNYELTENFTELRKLITVQTGVMDENPRKPEDVKESEYSVIERLGDAVTPVVLSGGQTVVNLDPSEKYKGGKINKTGYAFSVNADFNIKITYSSASKLPGVLVNAAGENLLYGSGEAVNLPAGTYMIQSEGLQPGDPKKLTPATFKETTIESIEITSFDPSKHYCNWVKDDADPDSKAPSCTDDGVAVYKCTVERCDQGGKKKEVVPALGHKYTQTGSTATCTAAGKTTYKCSVCGDTKDEDAAVLGHNFVWKTDKAATATETGLKHEECTRCGTKQNENTEIPAGTTVVEPPVNPNPGDNQVTEGGEFELYFTNKRPNGDTDFFTLNAGGGYSDAKGVVTVGETTYKYSLKMASSTVAFSCNDGATLYLAFVPGNAGLKVMVNTTEYTIGSDGTLKLENLPAGTYTIAKGGTASEKDLNYVLVSNPEPEITYYNVSFDFNDDDGKEPIVLQIAEGKSYAAMEALVPASFQKNGYTLKGLYKDADCSPEQAVQYPYTVTGNAILYADWEKDDRPVVKMHSIVFNTNGGSAVPDVRIAENQIYTITQRATKAGYAFAGWYDLAEGGNLVEMVDGSKLSGTYTVYAHWNESEKVSELDCSSLSKDISGDAVDITETTINGFTIHAQSGGVGVGTDGKEKLKYYMTAKKSDGMLYTNGVLIKADDENSPAEGNEDGVLKSIEFTTEGSGSLAVDVQLSGKSAKGGKYYLVLAHKDENGNLVEDGRQVIASGNSEEAADKTRAVREFDVPGANIYYLYALGDKGVAYANIKFTEQVYTVLYQVGIGTVPAGQESVTAREGEQVQLPVCTANPGYTFKGWSMDGGKTMLDSSYTVKEDDTTDGLVTITAYYELISYTVNFDVNGGTLPEGMTETRQATVEDTISLGDCVPKEEGQQFLGWTVNDSSNTITQSYKVNPADAVDGADGKKVITLKAAYTEAGKVYYTVKFDAGDGKLPETMGASCLKEAEAVVELGACTPPTAAQKFIGWSVEGTDKKVTSSYTVNPEDAKEVDGKKVITLKAIYTEEGKTYYTVKFSAESGSLPEGMDAEVTAEAGDLLTLGACVPSEADKQFKGWSVNGSTETITSEYKVKAEDADENGVITIKAVYDVKNVKKTGIAIIGLEPSYQYTGAKIIPNIGVVDYDVDDGRILAPGVDYSVQYKNNSKAGETAKVTVTGKGNYAGKYVSGEFKILEVANVVGELASLKGAKLGKIDALTYNGSAQYPKLTLTLKGGVAVEYTYDGTAGVYKAADGTTIPANVAFSNNTNKGTATILLTGANDNKKPTKIKKTFKINAVDISKATVVVDTQPGTYGVKGASPASITVTCDGVKLKNGTDYTVKYSANKKVTTEAKITITGKGNYTKKYTSKTYTINQLNLSETGENTKAGIKAVTAYTGVAAGKVKATVTDKDGNALKASQYTLKVYKDAKGESEYEAKDKLDTGKVYVQAIAKDTVNLTGATGIVEFDVAENIAKAKIELRKDGTKVMTKEYSGQAIELEEKDLTVKMSSAPDPLKLGTHYEIVSYSNNINKGTATAVIKGIGSYSGTKTVKFKIVGKTMKIENNKTTWDDVSSLIKGLFDR